MKLVNLFDGMKYHIENGTPDKNATALSYHSDKCLEGSVFFAIRGEKSDGHFFLKDAVKNGANILVIDKKVDIKFDENITIVRVDDTKEALATCSKNFFGNPANDMLIVGITGTKGKTTTSFMLKSILEEEGIKTGIIGTVVNGYEGNFTVSERTTPESYEIEELLYNMKNSGVKAVVIEVSSQSIMKKRVFGLKFDIAVFTNISPDHIGEGEHKDFEEYLFYKTELFKNTKVALINRDTSYFEHIRANTTAKMIKTFGSEDADFIFEKINLFKKSDKLGVSFNIENQHIEICLAGRFNAYNALSAISVARILGVDWQVIRTALTEVKIPGRVEIVSTTSKNDFCVLIDYAHNGIALKNLLESLREYEPSRLIVVFGCGGNRDKNRRFEMGEVCAKLADFTIVTSDNPRSEDPMNIIRDITLSISENCGSYMVIPDRKEAIERAITLAESGDIIVIAGKGHETYQIINNQKKHFDDKEIAERVL